MFNNPKHMSAGERKILQLMQERAQMANSMNAQSRIIAILLCRLGGSANLDDIEFESDIAKSIVKIIPYEGGVTLSREVPLVTSGFSQVSESN